MNKTLLNGLICGLLATTLIACSTPEEKAQKYYDKGMELLDTDPAKAKLEFQNALQMKKNMVPAIYGMALAAEKQADWQACFVLLNKVLNEDPKHIDATIKVGQLFLAAGEVKKAKEMVEKAALMDSQHLNLIVLQASIALKEKNYAEAVSKAKSVLAKDSKNIDALLVLASERYASNDIPSSLELLNRSLAIDNKNLVVHLFKIQVLESKSDIAGVEAAYKALLNEHPENHMVRTKLAEFYYNNNKKPEAEKELRLLVEKQPSQLEPKINLAKYLSATKGVSAGVGALQDMLTQHPDDYPLAFYLIGLYEQQKNTDAANALLQNIINNAGDKPEGLKAKVKVAAKLLQNNKKSDAVNLLNEILESDGGQQEALLLKAGIAIDEQRFDDAVLDLRSVLRDQPNQSQALLMMAKAYELSGSAALAEESYAKALETSKNGSEYAIAYANYLLGKSEIKRAEKVLEDALKKQASNTELIKLLAQIKLTNGDLQGAQLLADKVKNTNGGILYELIEGSILAMNKDYQGSLKAFMRAHEAAPNDMQPIFAIVRIHLNNKNIKEAVAFLDAEVKRLPDNYDLKLLSAQVAISSGSLAKAKDHYLSAIALLPKQSTAYQRLAYMELSQGNASVAKEIVQKGLVSIPNSFDLKMALAEIHQYDKELEEAIKIYEELMNKNPDSQVALNNYVSLIADVETNKTKLNEVYKLAKKLQSSNVPQFLDTYGWMSYRVGKLDEAEASLNKAIKAMPQYAVFHYHLGKVHWAMNDKKRAKQSLEKALELDANASYKSEVKELLKEV